MNKIINLIKLVKNYFVVSFLVIIFLASSWNLLQPGFFRAHDYVHGARIAEMTRALQDGHFPVRWSENFGYGFGMPLFEFYAPLPFYIGSLFYWLGLDLVLSVKLLFIITNIVTLLGAYKLGKILFGNRGGILLSAALTLAPYRAVNLFVRGAISEAWGIMALPWILYGVIKMIKNRNSKYGIIVLTLSLATLMLSHNLTTLMFVPFSFVFAIGYLLSVEKNWNKIKSMMIKIIGGYLLGGGLSAFYMLPAFVEKQFTQIDTILGGYFHYSNHFLYIRQFFYPNWGFGGSGWGPDDQISFFLGYGQIIALAVSILAFLYFIKKKNLLKTTTSRDFKFYLYPLTSILIVLSLFMTILKSKFMWDTLPLINFIQFPWRFLSVSIVFVAIITAMNMKLLTNIVMKLFYFLVIFWTIIIGNYYYFRPETKMENPDALYYQEPEKIRIGMSDVLKDYVPVQMSLEGKVMKKQFTDFKLPEDTIVEIDKTQEKLYSFNLNENTSVEFPIANFPGWIVELDGEKIEAQTSDNGLFAASIPKGKHQVGIRFGHSPIRLAADIISTLSLLIFLSIIIDYEKEKKKESLFCKTSVFE